MMGGRLLTMAVMLGLAGCNSAPMQGEGASSDVENAAAPIPGTIPEDTLDNAMNAVDIMPGNAVSPDTGGPVYGGGSVEPGNAAGGTADDPWCPAARAAMPAARCAALTAQRDSLEQGVAAFNPPRMMMRGAATRVVLAIGAQVERSETVRAAGGRPADVQVAPVRIGRYMRAALSGSAFDIVPIGDPRRDLGMSGSEQWEWDVTPTRAGDQTLQVRIETFAQDGEGHATRLKLYQSAPIAVSVHVTDREARAEKIQTAKDDIKDTTGLLESLRGWLLALAGVIVAASLVVWRMRGFGKKPDDDKNDPSGS